MLPKADHPWTIEEAAHLLRRAGFGGAPEEIRRLHSLGREKAVESLLAVEPIDSDRSLPSWADMAATVEQRREQMMKVREAQRELRNLPEEDRDKRTDEIKAIRQKNQKESRQQTLEGTRWWFDRIMNGPSPLQEKMVLFWHDHFATSARKVRYPVLILRQNELFRNHALGDFKKLTHEILRDPAMLLYLDVQNSRKGKPNENFAREVMELFTLGEGNYSEQDIREAARAFTGYNVNRVTGQVTHQKRQWDAGKKTVLGKTGNFDGDGVIDVLFEQDAAAEYVPAKLWQFFVEDEAPRVIVEDLAKTFRDSGFQIGPLLREIFLSRAFYDGTVIRNQIKSPIQFLVQMSKELGITSLPRGYAFVCQQQLGQVLFLPPNVAGWDWGRAWINTNTLLSRYNIAGVLTGGAAPADGTDGGDDDQMMKDMAKASGQGGRMISRVIERSMKEFKGPDYEKIAPRELRETPEKLVEALIKRFFQTELPPKQRTAFTEYAVAKKGVVFTDHEVGELCHLMMSTPHYQLV